MNIFTNFKILPHKTLGTTLVIRDSLEKGELQLRHKRILKFVLLTSATLLILGCKKGGGMMGGGPGGGGGGPCPRCGKKQDGLANNNNGNVSPGDQNGDGIADDVLVDPLTGQHFKFDQFGNRIIVDARTGEPVLEDPQNEIAQFQPHADRNGQLGGVNVSSHPSTGNLLPTLTEDGSTGSVVASPGGASRNEVTGVASGIIAPGQTTTATLPPVVSGQAEPSRKPASR